MYLYYSSTNKCIVLDNKYLAVGKFVLEFVKNNTKVSLLSTDGIEFMSEKLITELQDEHGAYYTDKADFLNKIGSSFFYINAGTMSDVNWTRTDGDNPFLSPTNAGDNVILTGDLTTPVIHPTADSTTAFKFTNADKSKDFIVFDTENNIIKVYGLVDFYDINGALSANIPDDITVNSVKFGDIQSATNSTMLEVDDTTSKIRIRAANGLQIQKADESIISQTIGVTLTDSNELEPEGSYYDLVTSKSGYARMFFGNAEGYADFIFSTSGVVTFINVSDNCYKTLQTGTNHVIIKDNGNNVRIVNEMGASKNFTLIIMYN